jgi:hypothetical protein
MSSPSTDTSKASYIEHCRRALEAARAEHALAHRPGTSAEHRRRACELLRRAEWSLSFAVN